MSWTFEKIVLGQEVNKEYEISPAIYEGFLSTFADLSPIHVDETFARQKGFLGRVMHGAILNGFLSEFIGVHFPGENALLLSVDIRYSAPSYLGDRLKLAVAVTQKTESQNVIVLTGCFENITQSTLAARVKVQVKVTEP